MKKYFVPLVFVTGVLFLALSVAAQPQTDPKAPKPAPKDRVALKEYLQLSPEQEAKLAEFRKVRAEERNAAREQMAKIRSELRTLLRDSKADQSKVDGLIDQLSQLQANRFKTMLQHRKEWEKILTPEQLDKLKDLREKMSQRRILRQKRMERGRFFGPRSRFHGQGRFTPHFRNRGRGAGFPWMWWE
ncbi:MAG: Spy/CpxP family protein refolding chaperone [Candidatus Aminicenantales bacterium]